MVGYGEQPLPPQNQPQDQSSVSNDPTIEDYMDYADEMHRGKQSNDTALQVREAQYTTVDKFHEDEQVFEKWLSSRRLIMARASRIPGIDSRIYNQLSVQFKYIVNRAHSEGKTKVLRAMCEEFDFDLELLVSKGDVAMTGLTGIGAMVTNNSNSKTEVRMPTQPKPPGFFPSSWFGGKQ
jgi:hypothetical protein